jgi:hypothetical protein
MGLAFLAAPANGIVWEPYSTWERRKEGIAERTQQQNGRGDCPGCKYVPVLYYHSSIYLPVLEYALYVKVLAACYFRTGSDDKATVHYTCILHNYSDCSALLV